MDDVDLFCKLGSNVLAVDKVSRTNKGARMISVYVIIISGRGRESGPVLHAQQAALKREKDPPTSISATCGLKLPNAMSIESLSSADPKSTCTFLFLTLLNKVPKKLCFDGCSSHDRHALDQNLLNLIFPCFWKYHTAFTGIASWIQRLGPEQDLALS